MENEPGNTDDENLNEHGACICAMSEPRSPESEALYQLGCEKILADYYAKLRDGTYSHELNEREDFG